MAETYAQRRNAVLKSLGNVKRQLNLCNGQLEQARREAVRLSDRKTIITPDQLVKLMNEWADTVKAINSVSYALAQLSTVARSFL